MPATSSQSAERSNSNVFNHIVSSARPRRDPRRVEYLTVAEQVYSTIYAAFKGDLTNLRRDFLRGVDMCGADYDGRFAPFLLLTRINIWNKSPYVRNVAQRRYVMIALLSLKFIINRWYLYKLYQDYRYEIYFDDV